MYQKLFGKEMMFIAIDKETYQLGVFHPSEEFIGYGQLKVEKAIEVWRRYFGPAATEDVADHYILDTL